jgi:hypothetical protein
LSLLNYSWFVVIKNSNPSIKKKLLPSSSEPVSCRSLINRLLLLRLNNPRPRQTRKKDGLLTKKDSNLNPASPFCLEAYSVLLCAITP